MGIPSGPNRARVRKIGRIFSENKKCELKVLAAHADFGDISEVKKAPVDRRDGSKNRMGATGNAIYQLGDMVPDYLANAAIIPPH